MIVEALTLWLTHLFGRHLSAPSQPVPTAPEVPTEPIAPVEVEKPKAKAKTAKATPKPSEEDYGEAGPIVRALKKKGYKVFENDSKPYNLNIVAIRTRTPEFDRFRCRLVHFWKEDGKWKLHSWPITTLPGKTYLIDRLLNPKGCAILAEGQYVDVYALDYHRGIYQALCQRLGSVRVYRDGDRDREYDMVPSTIIEGSFGINVHATENPDDGISNPVLDRIGSASAGCLVFPRVNDFVEARSQWRQAKANWGNQFTLTLISEKDLESPRDIPHEDVPPQHSKPESWTPPAPSTVGTRNRNLLNVKQGDEPWQYSTGKDARGHAIFPDYASGLRAGIINLRSYWVKHGLKTLSAICNRWAPASDTSGSIPGNAPNQPNKYAQFLANKMGLSVGDRLMIFHDDGKVRSEDQLFQLVSGMVQMETHAGVVLPRDLFGRALKLL